MTATVCTTYERQPISKALSASTVEAICDADERYHWDMIRVPGQLWQRESEREPIPTLRMNMALEYAHIRAILTH